MTTLRRIGLLGGLAAGPLAAGAQPAPPRHSVSWGARLAFNYANTNFNQGVPAPPAPVATTWRPGFGAGLWVRVALGHGLAAQQKYAYSQQSGEESGGPRYTLRYLSLPLLLRYQPLPRLALLAGPQFDLLIAADQDGTDITHDTEERAVGALAGLEVALTERLALGLRYTQGLNHVGIGQRSAGVREFRWQVAQAGLAVRF